MKVPMTKRGADLLRDELHRLKTVERPANSTAIGEARAHGDLSENAEYHAARGGAGPPPQWLYTQTPPPPARGRGGAFRGRPHHAHKTSLAPRVCYPPQ